MTTDSRQPKTHRRKSTPPGDFPESLTNDSERKWQDFQRAAEVAGIPVSGFSEILESLKRVFIFSDFAAETCTREPDVPAGLIDSGDLTRSYTRDEYHQKLQKLFSGIKDEETLVRTLRKWRRRELIRIAWRDLCGWTDLSETVSDLSNFADACLDHTLDVLYDWQCSQDGMPTAADGSRQRLVVLGLGKLGARELNFSSDIDLIFAYPETGTTRGAEKQVGNDVFFSRLCRRLIKVIGQQTSDGFVFRVDLRLRPLGESGPIVMDFDALEQYYQEQGREWERYALIKARAVAGDRDAGESLLNRLHPFIYRRYLDYSAFESLREMKQMIALEVKRKGMENNIKIGPGGIREIEFFGQIFQLIRGGISSALQRTAILGVLDALSDEGHIPQKVCEELTEAYVFLRNVENRLQMVADQQIHHLPSSDRDKLRLAASMGLASFASFQTMLEKNRAAVHRHFRMLLEAGDSGERQNDIENSFEGIWQNILSHQQAGKIIVSAGYDRPEEVIQLLDYLRTDPETRALSPRGRQRLDRLMPNLLEKIGASSKPLITLRRIIDLIKSIERRTSYLALLIENPTALTHLVRLSDASPWIASFLARHPVLLDELLDPRTLYLPPQRGDLRESLGRRISEVPLDDLEYQIEQLCIFKQINVLRVAAADVTGTLPLMRVSDYLTEIAEIILAEVIEIAYNHLIAKHGTPRCSLGDEWCARGFAVIAYGKMGGLELGYGSDLDLVFLHAGTNEQTRAKERTIDSAQFFNRLGQRVIHILTSHTRAGRVYEIDMRLRPSGSSGVLVSHIDAFAAYQLKEAWTWEHQALIKARPICGDDVLTRRFKTIRENVLTRRRRGTDLRADVIRMREKMRKELSKRRADFFDIKQDTGGMVDIEFLVQYLVLLNSHKHKQLVNWTDNVRLIQTLIETGVMNEYTAHVLKHAYLIYRAAAHQLSLQEKPALVPRDKFARLQKSVEEIWQSIFGDELQSRRG
jgi:glutamate-ammonia-ligase adenylyltransferase